MLGELIQAEPGVLGLAAVLFLTAFILLGSQGGEEASIWL